jgi:hypothetical protein
MSESSTPPGPMSTTSRDESPTSRPAKPRPRPKPKPSQKAKATTKRKSGTGKNIVPLVKRKALDEKRRRESYNNPLFICNNRPR